MTRRGGYRSVTFVTQVLAAARVVTSGYLVGSKVASENARKISPKKVQLHECVIRHLPGSGKSQPRANTWERVGFPVNGEND